MGQARAKKRAELARTTALERGAKKWDKSVLREVLRTQAPPGVEAIATRYDPGAQEILIACDDGIVRRVSWQMMADAEREQKPKLIIPTKLKDIQQQLKQTRQQMLEQAQREEAQRQQQTREQIEQERKEQREQEQRQQREAERGPDWELAAARCAEIEIRNRPTELLCACLRGIREGHPTHKQGQPCPERPAYAVIGNIRRGHRRGHHVLCESCITISLNYQPDPYYTLDCNAE